MFEVLSNIVDLSNLPGSAQLSASDSEVTFGDNILSAAEGYGVYLSAQLEQNSALLNGTIEPLILIAENIGMGHSILCL